MFNLLFKGKKNHAIIFLDFFCQFVVFTLAIWCSGALFFDLSDLTSHNNNYFSVLLYWIILFLILFFFRPYRRGLLYISILEIMIFCWWLTIKPKQFRNWNERNATLPSAQVNGNYVTCYFVRDYDNLSSSKYLPSYEMRKLDLTKLQSLEVVFYRKKSDLFFLPIILLNFHQEGRICLCIEPRLERNETFSRIKGYFRQYELAYVISSENDFLGWLKNNFHDHEILVATLNSTNAKQVLLDFIAKMNELQQNPQWYNSFTSNFLSGLKIQNKNNKKKLPQALLYLPGGLRIFYAFGIIDNSKQFQKPKHLKSEAFLY